MKTKADYEAEGRDWFAAGKDNVPGTSSWQSKAFTAGYEAAKADARQIATACAQSAWDSHAKATADAADFEIEKRVVASMPPEYVEALNSTDPRWLYGTFDESTRIPAAFQQIGRAWRMPSGVVAHIADLRRQLETEKDERRTVRLSGKIIKLQTKYAAKRARIVDFDSTIRGRFKPYKGAQAALMAE